MSSHNHAAREAEARAAEREQRRISSRLSTARLVTAIAAASLGILALRPGSPIGTGWGALTALLVFLVLVSRHDRVERRARWFDALAAWHADRRHRHERAWDNLPTPWIPDIDPHHSFAHDLDVFGKASLAELIGPPATAAGRDVLVGWLLQPGSPADVVARQTAIGELAAQPALREQLAAHARLVGGVARFDLRVFFEWSEAPAWLRARPGLLWIVRVLAILTPGLLVLQAMGVVAGSWWLLTLTAGLLLSWVTRKPMELTLGRATGWEPAIRAYVDWLSLVESAGFTAPALVALQRRLGTGPERASRRIRRFQRIVALADLRHNALLHLPVHSLTLWDFHVWDALERWKQGTGRDVRVWIETLGALEALVSLATLAADHPDWTFPSVDPDVTRYEAIELGHPLLRPSACVRNDVTVGPAGRVLCVTGSNMSGKSTLLRAIGANAVLAQAGAPACAARLTLPPVSLYTSLHVLDSLSEGVSFFMAALERLKRLVAATEASDSRQGHGSRVVLYLLDEILQGTNSIEREIAVRIVLRRLLATPAIGAITTHDLGLTATPELQSAGDHVHFRETILEDAPGFRMTFDYRLRPGVATSRNALALLRMVGLDDGTAD